MKKKNGEFWRKVGQWLNKVTEEKPSCRKCAVCHHVCALLNKNKKGVSPAEE